jgi:hypothetical protein
VDSDAREEDGDCVREITDDRRTPGARLVSATTPPALPDAAAVYARSLRELAERREAVARMRLEHEVDPASADPVELADGLLSVHAAAALAALARARARADREGA